MSEESVGESADWPCWKGYIVLQQAHVVHASALSQLHMRYHLCHRFCLACSSEQGCVTLLQPRGERVCEFWPAPICLCSGGGESCACLTS